MSRKQTYHFPFAAHPALRLALLFICGICFAHFNNQISVQSYLAGFVITSFLWLIVELTPVIHNNEIRSVLSICLYSILIITTGALLKSAESHHLETYLERSSPINLYEWEQVKIQGTIRSRGRSSSGGSVFEVDVDMTRLPEGVTWPANYTIRLYHNGHEDESLVIPTGHNLIEAVVELYAFPQTRNPHEFDYGNWLRKKSIAAHGELKHIVRTQPALFVGWEELRHNLLETVDLLFKAEQASLAKALFIGYKEELTTETRQAFSRAGLSHIMAVSGMHVGFIIAPFWVIIPFFWRWKHGKIAGLLLLTLLLFSYAGITGFSASVCRASIMAWLLTYGKLFQKLRYSINLLAVAAMILLAINPSDLFDVGFQLSFSAVLIILLIMPQAQKLIPLRYRYNKSGALLSIVIISVVVQAGLFPVLAYYFGEFSVMGPVANALVVPLLGLVVPVGLAMSVLGNWFTDAMIVAAIPAGWVLQWIGSVAEVTGNTAWSYITVDGLSPWVFPLWAVLIVTIASVNIHQLRWKLCAVILVILNITLIHSWINDRSDNELVLTALDVGQGDAIHIRTPEGRHILIDAGRWSPGGNSGERVLIPYLEFMGVNELDAVILSHPHADHIGGLPDLLRNIPIKGIFQSSVPYDSALYERYITLTDSLDVPVHVIAAGDQLYIDQEIRLFILGPGKDQSTGGNSNINNASVAFRLDYGATSFLFTGDAEFKQERELVAQYSDFLDVDFLKTGHHGSKTSSSDEFIHHVTPEITVTSLGFRNRFGHPHQKAIETLIQSGAKNYFTSLSGALIFTSDGKSINRKQ